MAKKLVWQIFLSCLGCSGVVAQEVQPEPRLKRQQPPHIAGPSNGYWRKERMEKARPMELHPGQVTSRLKGPARVRASQ